MKKETRKISDADSLRRKAEKNLKSRKLLLDHMSDVDVRKLAHELEVHQIELEMQNEELKVAQAGLEESRSKYADLYDYAPVGYFTLDATGLIKGVNLSGASLLHTERRSLIDKPFSAFLHSKDVTTFFSHIKKVFDTKSRLSCEIVLQLRSHSHKFIQQYIQMESIAVKTDAGKFNVLRTAVSNTTERKLLEEKLVRTGEEWERTFDTIPDIIMITDDQYRIIKANKALADRIGVSRAELIGQLCYKVMHGTDDPPSYCLHSKVISGGEEHVAEVYEDHLKEHFILSSNPMCDTEGNNVGTVEVFREISALKEMEEKLKVSAITDDLTGLFNRRGFNALVEQQCKLANRSKRRMLLLYMDIDNMKEINDKLGHDVGDQALQDTANVIRKTFRESDIKGRVGGDEFVVLLTDPGRDAEQSSIKHFYDHLQTFNVRGERSYSLLLSLGVATYDPENSCSVQELIKRADSSMFQEKKKKLENNVITGLKRDLKEKRKFERFETGDKCWAEIGASDRMIIKNMSARGICLTRMHHLMTSTFQSMKIIYDNERITVKGVMVWSQLTDAGDYEAGLKFIGSSDRDKQSLAKIISFISQ